MSLIPGQPDWLNMTGSQLEKMNEERCRNSPFGGRRDPTCSDFTVREYGGIGVSAPTDDSNRTSNAGLFDMGKILRGLAPINPAFGAAGAAADIYGPEVRKGVAAAALNTGFVIFGFVMVIGAFMLWANTGKSQPAVIIRSIGKGVKQGADDFREGN